MQEIEPLNVVTEQIALVFTKKEEPVPTGTYEIERAIRETFPEEPIMVTIAKCESSLDPSADRENLGVDVGLFQINQIHLPRLIELGLDRWNLQDNLTFARMLYDESGIQPWYMSEHCWRYPLS